MTREIYRLVLVVWVAGCANDNRSDSAPDEGLVREVDSDTGLDVTSSCDASFEAHHSLSPAIGTVGIVEWSTSARPSKAYIQFGRDTNYEYIAPVDLDEPNFQTLLLGMKPGSTYHYRFVLETDGEHCGSDDHTIDTGPLPTGLPNVTVTDRATSATSGDFIITTSNGHAIILDGDGDLVWWHAFGGGSGMGVENISRAHMSADGKSMWAGNLNVSGGSGRLLRIAMDGMGEVEDLIIDRHHDFCVLPDNSVAYIEFESDGEGRCDQIVERSAAGETTFIYRIRDDFSMLASTAGGRDMMGAGDEWCHSNAIHYVPSQDAYYLSVLNQSMIIKVSRSEGRLLWALDGDGDTVGGVPYLSGVTWSRQHGHHTLADGSLLLFNNGTGGFGDSASSLALKLTFDEVAGTAHRAWQYNGGSNSTTLGDVQQLSNGNVLVVYSNNGLMHEVVPSGREDGTLVRTYNINGFGYADARRSLYGPPDRF